MQTPPLLALESNPQFQQFWEAYPRKVAKADAEKAFRTVIRKTALPVLLEALERQKKNPDWTKQGGAFIPYPGSWLRAERWLDTSIVTTESTGLSPVQMQIHNGEYLRILEAMKSISHSYAEHQSWTAEDKQKYQELKNRRNQLRQMLGILR